MQTLQAEQVKLQTKLDTMERTLEAKKAEAKELSAAVKAAEGAKVPPNYHICDLTKVPG